MFARETLYDMVNGAFRKAIVETHLVKTEVHANAEGKDSIVNVSQDILGMFVKKVIADQILVKIEEGVLDFRGHSGVFV